MLHLKLKINLTSTSILRQLFSDPMPHSATENIVITPLWLGDDNDSSSKHLSGFVTNNCVQAPYCTVALNEAIRMGAFL